MIKQNVSETDIENALDAQWRTMDTLSVLQHHDAVAGTSTQYVADAYAYSLFKSFNNSRSEINKDLSRKVKEMTNIDLKP